MSFPESGFGLRPGPVMVPGPGSRVEFMGPQLCEGHYPDEPERYDALIRRYGENPVGLVAELAKKNYERKLMHEQLSAYGIVDRTPEGRELCLPARLAIALEELS